jgi:hypothetical protein
MMTRHDLLQYKNESAEDQRSFNRWLKVSAVVGSIFAAVVVAIAIAASDPGPREAGAKTPKATKFGTSEKRHDASTVMSAYELIIRIAPDQLPVEQVDEPF